MSREHEATEEEIVDNYRLDHLYTKSFRDGKGKYFSVVSSDPLMTVIEAEDPRPIRNKIKTRLTFIRTEQGGEIREIELKRFKYYTRQGYVEQPEGISFSFPYFAGLVGFLQSLAELNLNDISERRIPLLHGEKLDAETRRQFMTLAATVEGQELIREVVRNGQLSGADIVNIAYRKEQLEVFRTLLSDPDAVQAYRLEKEIRKTGDEAVWQHYFQQNTWIFGYGLNFVFNEPLQGRQLEVAVRGHDLSGAGKRSDAVLKTAGVVSSLCLVEIKTPNTDLLEDEPYRPDCWQPSKELAGGISQSQKTAQRTLENLAPEIRPNDGDGNPTGEILYSYRPKSFLIAGHLGQFRSEHGINREKFASFELLRRNTIAPEIITFDELYERAKFIVANSSAV